MIQIVLYLDSSSKCNFVKWLLQDKSGDFQNENQKTADTFDATDEETNDQDTKDADYYLSKDNAKYVSMD